MAISIGLDYLYGALTSISVLRLGAIWISYLIIRALYNVSPWHPLYRFPGPTLARMSLLYEFWFDFVKYGRYTREIQKMHDVYGPIVRISPGELHCNDPSFIDEIYTTGHRKRNKSTHFLNTIPSPVNTSGFGTGDHELHRIRRVPLSKFFSRQQIFRLESEIHDLVQRLCDKLLKYPSNKIFDLTDAYSCTTVDFISSYCFGHTLGFLDQDDWLPNYRTGFTSMLSTFYLFRFFPSIRLVSGAFPFLSKYPTTVAKVLGSDIAALITLFYSTLDGLVEKVYEDRARGKSNERPVLFSEILDSTMPEREKSKTRMLGEGATMMNAGADTVAWTLTVISFHILAQPETYARLESELRQASQDPKNLSWLDLEKVDYLYGTIMEGLRLSYGAAARLPRVAEYEVLEYRGEVKGQKYELSIPKGTPIGMSASILHHNEEIFPNSHEFVPERWLDGNGGRRRDLERYMLSFSKGSRQCLGMNLAQCQLHLLVAALTLRVFGQMKLYETTVEDVKVDHDVVIPQCRKESLGVRVVMT